MLNYTNVYIDKRLNGEVGQHSKSKIASLSLGLIILISTWCNWCNT